MRGEIADGVTNHPLFFIEQHQGYLRRKEVILGRAVRGYARMCTGLAGTHLRCLVRGVEPLTPSVVVSL